MSQDAQILFVEDDETIAMAVVNAFAFQVWSSIITPPQKLLYLKQ